MGASGGAASIAPSLGVGNPFGVFGADVDETLPSSVQACGTKVRDLKRRSDRRKPESSRIGDHAGSHENLVSCRDWQEASSQRRPAVLRHC